MDTFLIYLLKVVILQTVFFGLYWLLNRKSMAFHYNRFFLIATLILPFIIPFISIPINLFNTKSIIDGAFDPWYLINQTLPQDTASSDQVVNKTTPWWVITGISAYAFISVIMMAKLLADYFRIRKLGKESNRKEYTRSGFRVLYVRSKILSFSFLNKIFLSDIFPLEPHDKNTIITHEEYHLTQRHSLDIILSEAVKIICWINPVIHFLQKDLKETHEYLADRHTVKHCKKGEYANLLKSFKLQEINMLLGSAYSSGSISKRIKVMDNPNRRPEPMKMVLASFLALMMTFFFACEDNLQSFEQQEEEFRYEFTDADLEKEMNMALAELQNAPQDLIEQYKTNQSSHPEFRYLPAIHDIHEPFDLTMTPERLKRILKKHGLIEFEFELFRPLTKEEFNLYYSNKADKPNNIVAAYAVIRKADRLKMAEYSYKMNAFDEEIHDDYDKMASYDGGKDGLNQYLKNNLQYPELAKASGIEDRVVMSFVVGKSGQFAYLNVAEGPHTSDEEISLEFKKAAYFAIRATEGKWKPAEKDGKYVYSRVFVPVEFTLDN